MSTVDQMNTAPDSIKELGSALASACADAVEFGRAIISVACAAGFTEPEVSCRSIEIGRYWPVPWTDAVLVRGMAIALINRGIVEGEDDLPNARASMAARIFNRPDSEMAGFPMTCIEVVQVPDSLRQTESARVAQLVTARALEAAVVNNGVPSPVELQVLAATLYGATLRLRSVFG